MKALLLVAVCAFAQNTQTLENEHFTLRAPAGDTLIATPLELAGQLRLPAGSKVVGPTAEDLPPEIVIQQAAIGEPLADDAGETRQVRLKIMLFALGERAVPEIGWRTIDAGGMESVVNMPGFSVSVHPPKPGLKDSGDIRDIKGPYRLPKWPYVLALALLLTAMTCAGVWLHKRRKEPAAAAAPEAPVDARTPEEIALSEIDALPGLGLPVKEFYDRLSDIVRAYLEHRVQLPAMSATTHDLRRQVIAAGVDPAARALLKNLLERCDLAKFARYLPAQTDMQRDCDNAKRIVVTIGPEKKEIVGDLAVGGER